MEEFYRTLNDWLLPLGYIEVFSHKALECRVNSEKREFHFAKDGVRVICSFPDNTFHLHASIHKLVPGDTVHLITSKYTVGDVNLVTMHETIVSSRDALYSTVSPIVNGYIDSVDRYIAAEKFIMDLKWYESIFCMRKIRNFLASRIEKYKKCKIGTQK